MEVPEEPLNLTIKKKPVAVVAPSSIVNHSSTNKIANNKTPTYNNKLEPSITAFDLSTKNIDYFANNQKINNEKANLKLDNVYHDRNALEQELKNNIFNTVYKNEDVYAAINNKDLSNPENIYSMINYLAEHKFLTAWYMNSMFSSNFPSPFVPAMYQHQNPPNNNSILNNLLDKKVSNDDKGLLEIETLIKNEMPRKEKDPLKNTVRKRDEKRHDPELMSFMRGHSDPKNNIDSRNNQDSNNANDKKKQHIKKPLNAFMLYMKEMRAKVVAECTLKESAAINQILGRRWHSLTREEQAKYYEKARQERQLHMQLYPGWSARDNYGYGTKKKKRKKERTTVESGGNNMKKCRARYGLDQQSQWCKPCRRKKKCIRYLESGDGNDDNQSDDNLGSCGSVGDANTPPNEDTESLSQSMSSPGGLSALSSLTSPGGMVLPSPSTSVASPSVSAASPYMLQSPLTPHENFVECKPLPLLHLQPPIRNPVGTNPHDINNPLSVNQLTGQCIKSEPPDSSNTDPTRPIIIVT